MESLIININEKKESRYIEQLVIVIFLHSLQVSQEIFEDKKNIGRTVFLIFIVQKLFLSFGSDLLILLGKILNIVKYIKGEVTVY